MQLREWEWNIGMKQTGLGFVAQEIVKVAPHVVEIPNPEEDEASDDEFMHWNVDYGKLTPFLVGGMQELNEKIERLEALVASLVKEQS